MNIEDTNDDPLRFPDLRCLILRDVVGAVHRSNALAELDALLAERDLLSERVEQLRLRLSNLCDAAEWLGDPNTSVSADAKLRSLLGNTATARKDLGDPA